MSWLDTKTESKIRKMLLRDFQTGRTANQASMNIAEKFGVKGYGQRTCQRWFRKFRQGDLDLVEKPTHRTERERKKRLQAMQRMNGEAAPDKSKAKRSSVKVGMVTFRQEQNKTMAMSTSEIMERLISRKPEITISRLNYDNMRVPYRENVSSPQLLTPLKKQTRSNGSSHSSRSKQVRRPSRSLLKANLKLPPSIAKRMVQPHTSKEIHSIGGVRKPSQKSGDSLIGKKSITVQFQNVNPDLAKSTVRKATETTPLNATKRLGVPQSTPLASPKGVIYLNPQEIFRQSFDRQKSVARLPLRPIRSTRLPVAPKPVPKPIPPTPAAPQPPVEVSDSDSEDDIVLPENVSLPAPKMKAVTETFTTYWDMETDKPVLLNPTEDTINSLPTIEID